MVLPQKEQFLIMTNNNVIKIDKTCTQHWLVVSQFSHRSHNILLKWLQRKSLNYITTFYMTH